MSIEADLNAFRDLALEEQIKIPYYKATLGHLNPIYETLDPILEEIVGGHKVALTGEVYAPRLGENGQVLTSYLQFADEQPQLGTSRGVNIGNRTRIDDYSSDDRDVIAYWVLLGVVSRNSVVEVTQSQLYAFAPVETSLLHVPDLLFQEEPLHPEQGDRVAQHIDDVVLNDPKNFTRLMHIFDSISERPALEVEYYLNYLNTILPMREYRIRIRTSRFVRVDNEDNLEYTNLVDEDKEVFECDVQPTNFEYHFAAGGLGIVVHAKSKYNDELQKLLVPLRSLEEITLKYTDKKIQRPTVVPFAGGEAS